MTEKEQIAAFAADLHQLIERYCLEFELAQASAIGVLQMKVVQLSMPQEEEEE